MSDEKTVQPPTGPVSIKVRWGDDSDLPTVYANNLFITHQGGQFYLVFGEFVPPLLLDVVQEKEALPPVLTIKPVARLAVSPHNIENFVGALTDNLRKFREGQSPQKGGER